MPRVRKTKEAVKPYDQPAPKVKTEPKPKTAGANGGYNRALLVEEVAKTTNADWGKLGAAVGKTAAQCKDTWRKTVLKALLSGGEWCVTGPGWNKDMKQAMVNEIFDTAKPDWDKIHPLFPGKTPAQVKDVWRKVVAPKLKKGEALG